MNVLNEKPINEVMDYVDAMVQLWIAGRDVAIPYLVGVPGIAKTANVLSMCEANDWNLLHTHYSLRPIEEVSGLPQFKDISINGEEYKGTVWTLPDIMTTLYEIASNGKHTVWFLDDFHLATSAHLSLAYEMFSQDRQLRGYSIPKNVGFVLAGNNSSKAGAKVMFSAIVNRVAKFPVTLDFNAWKSNFALSHGVNTKVVSFLANESNKGKYFIGEESTDHPWPSPRSWTRLGEILSIVENNRDPDQAEVLYLGSAHIGDEAASEFSSHYFVYSKIDIGSVFDRRIPVEIPGDMMHRYIYMMASNREFMDRYLKTKPNERRDLTMFYSAVLAKIAMVQSEIAIAGLKEIIDYESSLKVSRLFTNVIDVLRQVLPPDLFTKIVSDIRLL